MRNKGKEKELKRRTLTADNEPISERRDVKSNSCMALTFPSAARVTASSAWKRCNKVYFPKSETAYSAEVI